MCIAPLLDYGVPDVFSAPNEDYSLPDADTTLKSFLKASCRKSRKPNFEFLIIIKVISILPVLHLFWDSEIVNVFSAPNDIEKISSRIGGRNRRPRLLATTSSSGIFQFRIILQENLIYSYQITIWNQSTEK